MTAALNYEALVQSFEEALVTKLRGHGAEADYLEMWVPDDDPVKSILNMVEAAELSGQEAFSVSLGQGSAAQLDVELLHAAIGSLAVIDVQAEGDGLRIAFTGIGT